MKTRVNHIAVCVCTFKRPSLLLRTLSGLSKQVTTNSFTYSIVVADNDLAESAKSMVEEFQTGSPVPIAYCVEPVQNIAMARNQALAHASGDFIAFLDDDEIPVEDWLLQLYTACEELGVDGVLGPVIPYFDSTPPAWITKGKFFERINHPTGYRLRWAECRTGNVLFRHRLLDEVSEAFRPQFVAAGEDVDFFRRMIERGSTFKWCSTAAVRELIPPRRCTFDFLVKRALLRGSNFPKHPADRFKNLGKSLLAVPAYVAALPFLAVCGRHYFVKYLVKLCEHVARLLAFSGIAVVKTRET